MGQLTQLWADSVRFADPHAQQQYVAERIGAALAVSRLKLYQHGFTTSATRVVIIFAPYVRAELELLDEIESRMNDIIVEVMDVRSLEGMEHLQQVIPGIGKVPQTPMIGVWREGSLVDSGWGFDARRKLERIFWQGQYSN